MQAGIPGAVPFRVTPAGAVELTVFQASASGSAVTLNLQRVRRESRAEQAASALRDYILANNVPLGSRLPAEPALAHQLGVSRNVLRKQ